MWVFSRLSNSKRPLTIPLGTCLDVLCISNMVIVMVGWYCLNFFNRTNLHKWLGDTSGIGRSYNWSLCCSLPWLSTVADPWLFTLCCALCWLLAISMRMLLCLWACLSWSVISESWGGVNPIPVIREKGGEQDVVIWQWRSVWTQQRWSWHHTVFTLFWSQDNPAVKPTAALNCIAIHLSHFKYLYIHFTCL